MTSDDKKQERTWESGFDGHQISQMRRLARLPFSKKLEWLEDSHIMALRLEEARRAREVSAPTGA